MTGNVCDEKFMIELLNVCFNIKLARPDQKTNCNIDDILKSKNQKVCFTFVSFSSDITCLFLVRRQNPLFAFYMRYY